MFLNEPKFEFKSFYHVSKFYPEYCIRRIFTQSFYLKERFQTNLTLNPKAFISNIVSILYSEF